MNNAHLQNNIYNLKTYNLKQNGREAREKQVEELLWRNLILPLSWKSWSGIALTTAVSSWSLLHSLHTTQLQKVTRPKGSAVFRPSVGGEVSLLEQFVGYLKELHFSPQ